MDVPSAQHPLLLLEDNDRIYQQAFGVQLLLHYSCKERGNSVKESTSHHTLWEILSLAWKGHHISPTALPVCIVFNTAVEASPVVLVENIAKGADNFHIILGDIILCLQQEKWFWYVQVNLFPVLKVHN